MCACSCGDASITCRKHCKMAKCMRWPCSKGWRKAAYCSSIWAISALNGSITGAEHQYWFVCRLREKTSYTVLHTFYTCEEVFDGLVWLGNYHAQAGHAVRLVRFRVGALTLTYLTNVLDPS